MRGIAGLALAAFVSWQFAAAEELKSGPEKRIGGSFSVKAFSGENKGKSLCYV